MLNITKKTDTFITRVYMTEKYLRFRLPAKFTEMRFAVDTDDAFFTLTEDPSAPKVFKFTNGADYVASILSYGRKWFPFPLFRGKAVDTEATYDGKTILVKRPVFQTNTSKIKRYAGQSHAEKDGFDDLRDAIIRINELAEVHKCELELKNNVLSGTIRV